MQEKQVADFYFGGKFLFRIGKVSYQNAHQPLDIHEHGSCMEFVFMIKGCQHYQVEGRNYIVYGGDVFQTFPGEIHGTGDYPEEKAVFYYLIVNPDHFTENGFACCQEEREEYLDLFRQKTRIRRLNISYGNGLERLLKLCQGQEQMKNTKIRNLLSDIFLSMKEKSKTEESGKDLMDTVIRYIGEHRREELEIEKLAALSGSSISRFKTNFLARTGITPREYVIRKKLEACLWELQNTSKTITEISFEYGFSSSQYFSTVFRKYYGRAPSTFRKERGEEGRYDKP